MSSPETGGTPEVAQPLSELVYETIGQLDKTRNIVFVAFEQIKGEALAKVFLEARVARLKINLAERGDTERDPLEVAINDMRYVAGYYAGGQETDKRDE